MVTNRVGQPVTGADFFDREREQARIWDDLHRDHLLLLAPRRVGKTSLMLRLKQVAPEKGFRVAYCSVADAQDETGFVAKLLAAVQEESGGDGVLRRLAKGPLGRFIKRVKRVEILKSSMELDRTAAVEWSSLGEALIRELDGEDGRWLVLVDELPLFVLSLLRLQDGEARARQFLSWFRGLRQRADLRGDLRWLLAGSIGLDTVTARLRAGDTINDLHLIHLGAFDRETADRLLAELSESHSFPLEAGVREHILARVGWLIPFHLQLVFSELRGMCGVGPATIEAVDEAFESLLGPAKKGYFDYWRQRLDEELGRPDGGYAIALLNAIARDSNGARRQTLSQVLAEAIGDVEARVEKLRYMLDVLESDGYLVSETGRYSFRSPLLREFWLRRVAP
jgi:AAA+ ATPase superfamily predicted ATPase